MQVAHAESQVHDLLLDVGNRLLCLFDALYFCAKLAHFDLGVLKVAQL